MATSKEFFWASKFSKTLLIGIIHAGTESWHSFIKARACWRYNESFFPLPVLLILFIVCFHLCNALLMLKFDSDFNTKWYHAPHLATSSVFSLNFLLSKIDSFWYCSNGFDAISSIIPLNCFHFQASSIFSGNIPFPCISCLFVMALAHSGATTVSFSIILFLFINSEYLEYNCVSSLNPSSYKQTSLCNKEMFNFRQIFDSILFSLSRISEFALIFFWKSLWRK